MSTPNAKNIPVIHQSTIGTLSEVEKLFVDRFVAQGKIRIVADEVPG